MPLLAAFVRGLLSMKKPWIAWVGCLIAANGIAPLYFLGAVEAQVVLAAALAGMAIQLAILRARGFVRLMGLGHVLWLAMLPWLVARLALAPKGSALEAWIAVVLVLDCVSLAIDVTDVVRYARGERAPMA